MLFHDNFVMFATDNTEGFFGIFFFFFGLVDQMLYLLLLLLAFEM